MIGLKDMAILITLLIIVVFDVAVWPWGVDSTQMGRDPRTEGRPKRWI